MAIFTPGPTVAAVSGSIGGTTYSRNRGGTYMRNRAVPVTSTTAAALAAKARLGAAATAWQGLTAAQRASWKAWAQANPFVNALGQSRVIPANAAYNSINTRLAQHSFSAISAPPLAPAPDPLSSLTQACDIGAGSFGLTFAATPLGAAEYLRIRAFVTQSASINYVENNLRVVGISGAAQASPFDHQSLVEGVFGTLQVGDYVHVRVSVLSSTTGLESLALKAVTAVTST